MRKKGWQRRMRVKEIEEKGTKERKRYFWLLLAVIKTSASSYSLARWGKRIVSFLCPTEASSKKGRSIVKVSAGNLK